MIVGLSLFGRPLAIPLRCPIAPERIVLSLFESRFPFINEFDIVIRSVRACPHRRRTVVERELVFEEGDWRFKPSALCTFFSCLLCDFLLAADKFDAVCFARISRFSVRMFAKAFVEKK